MILYGSSGLKMIEKRQDLVNNYIDILGYDFYPIEGDHFDAENLYKRIQQGCKAALNKPFWSAIQGFDQNVARGKQKIPTHPTPLQTRLLAHLSIAAGANGIIWYFLPGRAYQTQKDSPNIWKGVVDTVREMKKLHPYLVGDRSKFKLAIPGSIKYWSGVANDKRVLALMNISHNVINPVIDLKRPDLSSIKRFENEHAVKLDNGKLKDEFKGYEVKIFIW